MVGYLLILILDSRNILTDIWYLAAAALSLFKAENSNFYNTSCFMNELYEGKIMKVVSAAALLENTL